LLFKYINIGVIFFSVLDKDAEVELDSTAQMGADECVQPHRFCLVC